VNKLGVIMESAMGPGGVWEDIQHIKKVRDKKHAGFCWRSKSMRPVADGKLIDCEMPHLDKCYGACPFGYKPTTLTGKFSPVCESSCSDSTLPVACGFGCARGVGSCSKALLKQMGSAAQVLATGYDAMAEEGEGQALKQVNRIILLTDFFIDVLGDLVKTVQTLQAGIDGDEMSVEVVILLFEAVKEAAPAMGEDFKKLQGAMKEIVSLLVQMLTPQDSDDLDFSSLKDALLDSGDDILDSAVNVVHAFSYGDCKPLAGAAFTLDEMGDDRLMGPWEQRGTMRGKPKYTIRDSREKIMEWSEKEMRWEIFVDKWCGIVCFGGRKILYFNIAQSYDFPVEGWKVETGIAPAPLVIAMREPLTES